MLFALWFGLTKGKFDVGFTLNGMLGGLVAITAPCYWVSPFGALMIGFIAGIIVFLGIYLMEYLRIDDPVGAVSVHGLNGIWGTLSLGFFACGLYGSTGPLGADDSSHVTGLFYGGGSNVLMAQAVGSAIVTILTFAVSMVLMLIVSRLPNPWKLRVEAKGEIGDGGIDIF